jgi:hypothetical protein
VKGRTKNLLFVGGIGFLILLAGALVSIGVMAALEGGACT